LLKKSGIICQGRQRFYVGIAVFIEDIDLQRRKESFFFPALTALGG